MSTFVDFQPNIDAETEALGGLRPIAETLNVLIYEVGGVAKSIVYADSKFATFDESRALYANALLECADILTQVGILHAKLLPLVSPETREFAADVVALIEVGQERQLERMREILNRRRKQEDATSPRDPAEVAREVRE